MKNTKPNILLEIISVICIIAGSLMLSLFYLTSWANSLIFDTNAYLNVITPLTKNADVSKALSTYTVDTLFQNVNVEERIRTALPEQGKFLASQLTDQLQDRSYNRTTQIIQSDQFSSVWVAANTFFHKRVLEVVRGGGILSQLQEKVDAKEKNVNFDASQLAQIVKDRLGSENSLFSDAQIDKFKSIVIPTYTNLENIRQVVYWISQLTAMLLPASLALLLLGIALAFSRQKGWLITGITLIVVMLISLLTLAIIKNDVLGQITQSTYQDAARAVWDSFLGGLTRMLWLTVLGSMIIIGLTLLFGPYRWAENFRKSTGISQLQKSKFMNSVNNVRVLLARYALWLILFGVLITLIVLFSIENLTIATVVVVLSYFLLYVAILLLIFPRKRLV